MTSFEQGDHSEHLEIAGVRGIQGSVTGGATVRSGGELQVQGEFSGPLVIEADAKCAVDGTFQASSCDNKGLLLVAGVVASELPKTGKVLVGVGTLLAAGRTPGVLGADGSVTLVRSGNTNITIGADQTFFRLQPDGTFVLEPPEG